MVEDTALLRQQPRHHIPKCRALIDNNRCLVLHSTEYGTQVTNRIPQTSRWTLPARGIANRSVWRSSWLNLKPHPEPWVRPLVNDEDKQHPGEPAAASLVLFGRSC
jgi:hypothetical protein